MEIEGNIQKFWEDNGVYDLVKEQNISNKTFKFFDGPPFMTGKMHHGHVLAGSIKDTIARYKHQNGFNVPKRFGSDCHGLPVENEINKKYSISSKKQILEKGVYWYNEECRSIVTRCASDWKNMTHRLGRWIDFETGYKTMDLAYMSSVWSVFKKMYDNDFVYKDYKIMPFSTGLGTPLSKSEIQDSYQDTTETSIIVAFKKVENDLNDFDYFLVWTTTPWTLIDNSALCINKDLEYVIILMRDGKYLICKECLNVLEGLEYTILKNSINPDTILNAYYYDLFNKDVTHVVISDAFVNGSSGTGIVHIAPAYGEDDLRTLKINNNITDFQCSVSEEGLYNENVYIKELKGLYIKNAKTNKIIFEKLGSNLILQKKIKHSIPFCPRTNTPVMYRLNESYFINVSRIKDRLVELNKTINWVPANVGTERFNNWLENAHDWNISRNRYWGNPIPIWTNGTETICIGSVEELRELSGRADIVDIHRHLIDDITIPSKKGLACLRRIPDIFDCWFESGAMPFASNYADVTKPMQDTSLFEGDFIAEGLDQTRGWFYSMLVISTIIMNKTSYKNVIVNGLILANDGKKMSKSMKNYPELESIVDNYGADVLRIYLLSSNAVEAESLSFNEKGIKDMYNQVFILWKNSINFYNESCKKLEIGFEVELDSESDPQLKKILDKWVLSEVNELVKEVRMHMDNYKLRRAIELLKKFISDLSKWYIKLARIEIGKDPEVLYTVLCTYTLLMAPFTPFYSEHVYQTFFKTKKHVSIHMERYPEYNEVVEVLRLDTVFRIIEEGRALRHGFPLMRPMASCTIKGLACVPDGCFNLIKRELNLIELIIEYATDADTTDDSEFCMIIDKNYNSEVDIIYKTRLFKSSIVKFRKSLKLKSWDKKTLYIDSKEYDFLNSLRTGYEINRFVSTELFEHEFVKEHVIVDDIEVDMYLV